MILLSWFFLFIWCDKFWWRSIWIIWILKRKEKVEDKEKMEYISVWLYINCCSHGTTTVVITALQLWFSLHNNYWVVPWCHMDVINYKTFQVHCSLLLWSLHNVYHWCYNLESQSELSVSNEKAWLYLLYSISVTHRRKVELMLNIVLLYVCLPW